MTRVGSDLFIIDNTDSKWDVLRYLTGWCRLSAQIDVAIETHGGWPGAFRGMTD